MGEDWKQGTGGRVSLIVFSGGAQGDESTVLRKMRLHSLQGASLTVVGLAAIDWSFNVFGIPFFFESYDELNVVVEKITPLLKQRAEAKGFVRGFLTPLVGINIFLASYRFNRSVLEVARAALPMTGILGIGVLLITYVPWLTLGILHVLGRA